MTALIFAGLLGLAPLVMLAPDPIDPEIALIKPEDSEPPAEARSKCRELVRQARTRGVHTLLMGFEGQGGFAPDNTLLVYRYLWRLSHGVSDLPPDLDTRARYGARNLRQRVEEFRGPSPGFAGP